jgi:hypothetical protein
VNWSIESKFVSGRVNQEAIRVAMGAMYAYANLETVGSSIIAVTTQNRSLLPLISASQGVFLAPSSYGANRAPFSDRRWDTGQRNSRQRYEVS